MNKTSRFTTLLGECRRQMNGAVAGSMRYYGADYGLNYGVSLPTIRSLAANEGKDHNFAKYLYQQEVREIRLIALHIAEPEKVTADELNFWAAGIINSEIAEEAAFALIQHVELVRTWLHSQNPLLLYTSLLSISKSKNIEINNIKQEISHIVALDINITNNAIITLLENYYRDQYNQDNIDNILKSLPDSKASRYIKEEMEWRCEVYR